MKWDNLTNARGRAVYNHAMRRNYKVTPTSSPSYKAKGRVGESKQELLLDREEAEVDQPNDKRWIGSSHHTPIMYTVREANITKEKLRVSKTMLNYSRNKG